MRKSFSILRRLSAVQRFSHTRLLNPESVLEHLGFNTLLTYIICERLRQAGEPIDTGLALKKSIVHDIDETVTGDIPRPTKYFSDEIHESLDKLATAAAKKIGDDLRVEELFDTWANAKGGKEGAVLALSDIAAVAYKVHQEACIFGNRSIVGHVGPTLKIVKDRLKDLEAMLVSSPAKVELHFIGLDLIEACNAITNGRSWDDEA